VEFFRLISGSIAFLKYIPNCGILASIIRLEIALKDE